MYMYITDGNEKKIYVIIVIYTTKQDNNQPQPFHT